MQSKRTCHFILAVVLFAALQLASAQVPEGLNTGLPPDGVFSGSSFDSVQLNNGNLHIEIPLYSIKGRNGLDVVVKYVYGNNGWEERVTGGSAHVQPAALGNHLQWDVISPVGVSVKTTWKYDWCTVSPNTSYKMTSYVLTEPNGTQHTIEGSQLIDLDGGGCQRISPNLYAQDASGWTLSFDSNGNPQIATDKSGRHHSLNTNVVMNNGVKVESGLVTDSNGNTITGVISQNQIMALIDTLGRTLSVKLDSNGDLSYQDSNGVAQKIHVDYTSVNVSTNLCSYFDTDAAYCHEYTGTWSLPSTITLANGSYYQITYDPAGYGEPSSIRLPTGATISWTYGAISPGFTKPVTGRRVLTRTVTDIDGSSATWTYSYNKMNGWPGDVTETDPGGRQTKHYFGETGTCTLCRVQETEVDYYDGAVGAALLKKVVTEYAPNAGQAALPFRVTTTWAQQNFSSKVETDWDVISLSLPYANNATVPISWGNPLENREYGFDGSLIRRTHYNYKHLTDSGYRAAGLANLVTSKSMYPDLSDSSPAEQTTFTYDGGSVTSTNGAAPGHDYTNYSSAYSVRGNLTNESRWLNTTGAWLSTDHTYDDLGNLRSTTDPGDSNGNRHTATFSYVDSWSGSGCVQPSTYAYRTEAKNALGHRTWYKYYPCTGQLHSVRDENDIQAGRSGTQNQYDGMGRVKQQDFSDGGQIISTYTDSIPASTTSSRKADATTSLISSTTFDGLGRVSVSQQESGALIDTTYDALGRKHCVSNPYNAGDTKYSTCSDYDALGRVVLVTEQDSNTIQTDYSGSCSTAAMPQTVTDETGRKRKSCLDALGRLLGVWEDPNGLNLKTDYGYDILGNLNSVTQSGSRPRTFTYDSLSRLVCAANPEVGATNQAVPTCPASPSGSYVPGTIRYTYDPDGNVASETEPQSNQTSNSQVMAATFCYDSLHRLGGKAYGTSAQACPLASPAVTMTYDAGPSGTNLIGRLSSDAYNSVSNTYSYDAMGRTLSVTECAGSPMGCVTTSALWNVDGTLQSLAYPSKRVLKHSYDSGGRLATVLFDNFNGTVVNYPYYAANQSYGYWPSGLVKQAQFGNGLYEFTHQNKRLQADGFTVTNTSALACGSGLMQLSIGMYDPNGKNNGNVWSVKDFLNNDRTQIFDYDALNRVTYAVENDPSGWGESRSYDAWGNPNAWTLLKGSLPQQPVGADSHNRLGGFSFDAAGNLIQNGSTQFTYDSENRMTSAGVGSATYAYDANGHRVNKNYNGDITQYVYFAGQPIAEFRNSTWSDYVFADSKRIAISTSTGAGDPNATNAQTTTSYYHGDQLGSARMMTDGSGNISWRATYTPFGYEVNAQPTSNHYKFTGKERDTETGLDYFGARYYGSNMGRFMSPDWSEAPEPVPYARLDDPQTLNLYSYVRNNPLSNEDPDGHDFFDWLKKQGCNLGATSLCTPGQKQQQQQQQDKQNLVDAQDAARENPKFQPGATTHCNQATCAVVNAVGGPMGPLTDKNGNPLKANQQAENLANSNQYREVTPREAQQIANNGGLVIAAYKNTSGGSGHLTTVRPEGVPGDNPPAHGRGPLLNDIGRNVRVANQNYAFSKDKTVRYYTPKGN